MNEIIEILKAANPTTNGYRIESDKDRNSYFVSEQAGKKNIIWIQYSSDKKELEGLVSSIVFSSIQKEYAELCFPIITKNPSQKLNKSNLSEQLNNPTINCGTKMESPNGILESKFINYDLCGFKQLGKIKSVNTNEQILNFANWYYNNIEKSFFSKIRSLEDLDELTDNLSIYELGLYLTNVPRLKKILIKYLLNKSEATEIRTEYEEILNQNEGNKMVDLILQSLNNIKLKYEN